MLDGVVVRWMVSVALAWLYGVMGVCDCISRDTKRK